VFLFPRRSAPSHAQFWTVRTTCRRFFLSLASKRCWKRFSASSFSRAFKFKISIDSRNVIPRRALALLVFDEELFVFDEEVEDELAVCLDASNSFFSALVNARPTASPAARIIFATFLSTITSFGRMFIWSDLELFLRLFFSHDNFLPL